MEYSYGTFIFLKRWRFHNLGPSRTDCGSQALKDITQYVAGERMLARWWYRGTVCRNHPQCLACELGLRYCTNCDTNGVFRLGSNVLRAVSNICHTKQVSRPDGCPSIFGRFSSESTHFFQINIRYRRCATRRIVFSGST